jgi:penicillin-binding protein 2
VNAYHPHLVARRGFVAGVVVWGTIGVLLAAFFRTQILSAGRYQLASEQNRLRAVPVPAPRGLIVDRHGEVLAENEPGYSVGLLASSVDSLAAELKRIAPLVGVDTAAIPDILGRYRRKPSEVVTVRRDVPFETISALPGVVERT